MKYTRIYIFLVLISTFFLSSCKKDYKENLTRVKEWKLLSIQSAKMEDAVQKLDEKERKPYQKVMRNLLEKSSFVFNEDNTYEITIHVMGATETTKGTWEINEKDTLLIFKEDNAYKKKSQIHKFKFSYDQEKLILKEAKDKKTIIELIPV